MASNREHPANRWRAVLRAPRRHVGAVLRAPLLHFIVLGGLLAGLRPADPPRIVVDAAMQERLRRDFERREARPPSDGAFAALVDGAIDEEVLLHQAIGAGWLRHDGTVLSRLAQLGRFVGPTPAAGASAGEPGAARAGAISPDEAVARARELGLDRGDPVIRRYLVERARLAIAAEADRPEPNDAELAAFLEARAARFRLPERLRLRHVFARGDRPDANARATRLARTLVELTPDDTAARGDPFPGGRRVVASREELARRFGARFAASLDLEARGRWQGPLPSAHGLHLVWLEEPLPARDPALAEVRGRVRQALLQERRTRHLRRRLDELRAGFRIEIE